MTITKKTRNARSLVVICIVFSLSLITLHAWTESRRIPSEQGHVLVLGKDGNIACRATETQHVGRNDGISLLTSGDKSSPNVTVQYSVAQSTFQVTYSDFPPPAQIAFQRAVDIWARLVKSPVTIRIDASFEPFEEDDVLGAAGPTFFFRSAGADSVWFPSALADAISGGDLAAGEADIMAKFNSDFADWYFGTDQNPGEGQFDFTTVVLHEIAHGLGFAASFDDAGGSGSWGLEDDEGTFPMAFDTYLINGEGVDLVDETAFENGSPELGAAIKGNDVHFFGFFAGESVGWSPVSMYAPEEWESSTSIAHLNKANYPVWHPDALMAPSISPGVSIHDPGPIVVGMFRDIFWTAASTLHFAQFAAGSGLSSDVVVTNPSVDTEVTGEVHFFDAEGATMNPADILADGSNDASFTLAPLDSVSFKSRSTGSLAQGSATITSSEPVSGVIRFDISGTGVAGVGSSQPAFEVIVPVRRAGGLSTGAAIRNVGLEEVTVTLMLTREGGTSVPNGEADWTIPPQGRLSKFIQEYFPNADTSNFTGTMTVRSPNGKVSVVGLEFEAGARFTTLPVSPLR